MGISITGTSCESSDLVEVDLSAEAGELGQVVRVTVRSAGRSPATIGRVRLTSDLVVDELVEHGYQSWSTVRPCDASDVRPLRSEAPRWFRNQMSSMGELAGRSVVADTVLLHGRGLVAQLDLSGPPVAMVASPGDGSVEIWIDLEDVVLDPGAEISAGEILIADGDPGSLYSRWADLSGSLAGARTEAEQPLGWCSWYEYFTEVTAADIRTNLSLAAAHGFDLVQIDDGWQPSIGEWTSTADRFGSPIAQLADEITSAGLRAGIWSAPFLAIEGGPVATEHPGWLVRNERGTPRTALHHGGWGGRVYALDASLPEVREHLVETYAGLRAMGFDYFKIDFLHAGAVPGLRAGDGAAGRSRWLRAGLDAIRAGIGDDATLLGCGSPLAAAVGVVDAMRVSEDVAPHWGPGQHFPGWEESSVGTANAIDASLRRAPLHRRWFSADPDCLLLRPTGTELDLAERRALAAAVLASGGFCVASDDLQRYGSQEWDLIDEIAEVRSAVDGPVDLVDPLSRHLIEVVGSQHRLRIDLSDPAGFESSGLGPSLSTAST